MKAGLTTSVVLHAVAIGFGLFSLSSSRSFEAADVESMPVDIVPVESITQIQKGDKKAPPKETPSPRPTTNPRVVEEARNVGENDVDLDAAPTPEPTPRPVEKTASAEPEPKPEPKPEKAEETPPEPVEEEVPVPATEREPEPQPRQEVEPDPAEKTAAVESPEAESLKLPDSAPVPEARPQPPKAQTAKAPERKDAEKPAKKKETASREPEAKKQELLDEVAALLDKQKPSGGGAERSRDEASLGGEKTTGGEKLTQSEMDALRGQIQRCWNVPAGAANADNLKVSIHFQLDRSGAVEGSPNIVSGGGAAGVERVAAESARRAILQCAPYDLPGEKYEAWSEVVVNFDPSEMF